ncbi:MAG: hypothetical protein JO227_19120 [Acetobacteraceae bacterium]|nr:hypothetical protein [Acetobacteraceae bacterium]
MRAIAVVLGLAVALPVAAVSVPARADNDFLNQAQRFLGNNNNKDEAARRAYEQGRADQIRRDQAARDPDHRYKREDQYTRSEDWRDRHDRDDADTRYPDSYRR